MESADRDLRAVVEELTKRIEQMDKALNDIAHTVHAAHKQHEADLLAIESLAVGGRSSGGK